MPQEHKNLTPVQRWATSEALTKAMKKGTAMLNGILMVENADGMPLSPAAWFNEMCENHSPVFTGEGKETRLKFVDLGEEETK
jgi:hypothetical protein